MSRLTFMRHGKASMNNYSAQTLIPADIENFDEVTMALNILVEAVQNDQNAIIKFCRIQQQNPIRQHKGMSTVVPIVPNVVPIPGYSAETGLSTSVEESSLEITYCNVSAEIVDNLERFVTSAESDRFHTLHGDVLSGSPGIGKSTISWAFIRSKFMNKKIFYVFVPQSWIVVSFSNCVLILETSNMCAAAISVYRGYQPSVVVFDGAKNDNVGEITSMSTKMFGLGRNTQEKCLYLLVSSEQIKFNPPFHRNFSRHRIEKSWTYSDYENCFMNTNIWKQFGNILGLTESSTPEERRTVLMHKYYYAGTNAGYMFEMTIEEVITDIKYHVNRVGAHQLKTLLLLPPASTTEHCNNLITFSGHQASGVTSLFVIKALPSLEYYTAFVDMATKARNDGLLGWIFENEVSYQIRKTKEDFVFCDGNGNIVENLPSFTALASEGVSINDVQRIEFDDENDFIDQIVKLCGMNNASSPICKILSNPVWCFPNQCSNAFFDFACIHDITRRQEPEEAGTIVCRTFVKMVTLQATISMTHSCDQESVLGIGRKLRNDYNIYLLVDHYPVLPSIGMINQFQFTGLVGMEERSSSRLAEQKMKSFMETSPAKKRHFATTKSIDTTNYPTMIVFAEQNTTMNVFHRGFYLPLSVLC